jgi:hypothetical protein
MKVDFKNYGAEVPQLLKSLLSNVRQVQAVQDRWFGASFAKVYQQKSTI